jgi:hypothetical protein
MPTLKLPSLDDRALGLVVGGEDKSIGRCGLGDSMPALGNVRTRQCYAHDKLVNAYQQSGSSTPMAHLRSIKALGPAVGSYLADRYNAASDWVVNKLQP